MLNLKVSPEHVAAFVITDPLLFVPEELENTINQTTQTPESAKTTNSNKSAQTIQTSQVSLGTSTTNVGVERLI